MIRWDLTDTETQWLQRTLHNERERLNHILSGPADAKRKESVGSRKQEIERLLSSLGKAKESTEAFDLLCYCDTNYDFYAKTMTISYRIGDEDSTHQETVEVLKPPPDEYLGIMAVLRVLMERKVTGRVRVITDAARCALALQMGLQYKVPNHSSDQSPRSSNFGYSYDATILLTKELLKQGCRVEFAHKHRNFINQALGLR